jgi:hypothetical protein
MPVEAIPVWLLRSAAVAIPSGKDRDRVRR